MKRTFFLALGLSVFAGTAMAQNVNVDFNDGTLGGLVTTSTVIGAPAGTSTGTAVAFNGVNDGGRAYLGTTFTDYASADFTASIDVTVGTAGGANAFFGLGPGIVGGDGTGGGPSFGEPSIGPAIYVGLNENGRDGGEANLVDSAVGGDFISNTGGDVVNGANLGNVQTVVGSGTHTLSLVHSLAGSTLEILADVGQAGAPVSLGIFDTSDNGFDATNAGIFFGGDDGTVFDNFNVTVPVIPEPSSLTLLGLGLAGIMCSRRRRS